MGVTYRTPGESLTADHWNELINAIDAKLVFFYNGLSLFMGAGAYLSNRVYWMFDPATPAWNLHPLAPAAMSRFGAKLYNHAALLSYVAALPVDTVGTGDAQSDDFHVIRLNNQNNPAPNSLKNINNQFVSSLSVLTRTINGQPYNVSIWGPSLDSQANGLPWLLNGALEIPQPLEMIEVCVIGGIFNWDSTWNKFGMIRVHNFGNAACSARFPGGLTVNVPAGSQRCIRQVNGAYSAANVYLHQMQSGDGRYFDQSRFTGAASTAACSVSCPANVGQFTAGLMSYSAIGMLGFPRAFDATLMWDISSVQQSPFVSPSMGNPIFDLVTYQGGISGTVNTSQVNAQFNGFNNLQAMFQSIGLTYSYNPATFGWTLSGVFNLTDITTNAIHSLTGASHTITQGGGTASGSLSAQMQFGRSKRLVNGATSSFQVSYSSYTTDSNGNYVIGDAVNVTITNQSGIAQPDPADSTASVTWRVVDSPQTIANGISGSNCGLISVSGFQITNTPFGPFLSWTESYALNKFTYNMLVLIIGDTASEGDCFVSCDGVAIKIKRCIPIAKTFASNQFPVLTMGMKMLPWHYPRLNRKSSAPRQLSFAADACPWQILKSRSPDIIEPSVGLASATVIQP